MHQANTMTAPRQTRRKLLLDNVELALTNDEGEFYLKIHDELKKIEQKIKTNELIDILPLKNTIQKIFEQANHRNKEFDRLSEEYNILKKKLADINLDKSQLIQIQEQYKQQIKNLLEEHEEILEDKNKTIADKNEEISTLKKSHKPNNENQSLAAQLALDVTCSQDFFKTPENNHKPNIMVPTITPYSPNKSRQQDAFYSTKKSPIVKTVHNIEFEQNIETRMKHMEENVKSILDKLNSISTTNMETNISTNNPESQVRNQQTQSTSTNKTETASKNSKEKDFCDILLLGDIHLKEMKTTLSKYTPNNWKIEEAVVSDATIPDLCTSDQLLKCSHLIFMAGSNDIQKTPMKDMKKSLDLLFKNFKSSTIHFIQIPYRYDNININYHIEQVNNALQNFVKRYKNVITYKTKDIIENWDYSGQTTLNQNGLRKISQQLCNFLTDSQYSARTFGHQEPRPARIQSRYSHPVERHQDTRAVNYRTGLHINSKQHTRNTYPNSSQHESYVYNYDTDFPPYRQRRNYMNNFRY